MIQTKMWNFHVWYPNYDHNMQVSLCEKSAILWPLQLKIFGSVDVKKSQSAADC